MDAFFDVRSGSKCVLFHWPLIPNYPITGRPETHAR